MKKIILISGKARSGKDCGGSYIADKLRDKGYRVVEDRFAKYIKGYLKDYYYKDWDGETKTDEIREKLQKLGTEKIKEKLNYKSFHAKRLSEDFQIVGDDFDYFIVTDTRFPDEIYTFKAMFGDSVIKTLRIERQKYFTGGLTSEHLEHKSEIALDDFVFENVIYNIGSLEEYYNKLDKYINKIFMEDKEELQKIASTMTKGEFIEKYHYNSSDCPEEYGLKESSKICNGSGNCTKCWEEAICELEFREDNVEIENKNKEKELNIIEASNLKNTEFKVIDSEGYQLDDNIKTNSNGNFLDMCGNLISSKLITYDLINAKFIPVKKPVTINEVLNSNKLCKIKHKDLYYRNESYYKEYHSLEDLLHELTEDYSDARTILREAEWYLQED